MGPVLSDRNVKDGRQRRSSKSSRKPAVKMGPTEVQESQNKSVMVGRKTFKFIPTWRGRILRCS